MDKQEKFLNDFLEAKDHNVELNKMVVAVKLPTGATELIINTEQIDSKVDYYMTAYNEEMKLINNPAIQIVAWLFA